VRHFFTYKKMVILLAVLLFIGIIFGVFIHNKSGVAAPKPPDIYEVSIFKYDLPNNSFVLNYYTDSWSITNTSGFITLSDYGFTPNLSDKVSSTLYISSDKVYSITDITNNILVVIGSRSY
jgi:hypothetical protein